MNDSNLYTFRPRPEVADWIDENIDSWTSYCYDKIYRDQKKNYIDGYNRAVNRIAFVLIGMILVSLTYAFPLLGVTYIVFLITGITVIIIGSISFLLEVRPHGRR